MKCIVTIRLYGDLNNSLPRHIRQRSFSISFVAGISVKELLLVCDVAYEDVDLVLVKGKPVGFDYQLQTGDRISIYPLFSSIDISPINLINRDMVQ